MTETTISTHEESFSHSRGQIQVGGDWFLQRRRDSQKTLLLVAGGVGINPILSMLRHLSVENDGWEKIVLLYAGRHWDDILYKDEALRCLESLPQLEIMFFLSNQISPVGLTRTRRVQFCLGRLSKQIIAEYDNSDVVSYLCGPPSMSDEVSSWMKSASINYEKWW